MEVDAQPIPWHQVVDKKVFSKQLCMNYAV